MYIMLGIMFLTLTFYITPYIYQKTKYHDMHYIVSREDKKAIEDIPIYYSLGKGFYELSVLMTLVVFSLLYTYSEIPQNGITPKEDQTQVLFLFISGILFFFSLSRALFILTYKVVIKDNSIYYKSLFTELEIPLNRIKEVTLTPLHYIVDVEGMFFPLFIPIGLSKGYIIYRVLLDWTKLNISESNKSK